MMVKRLNLEENIKKQELRQSDISKKIKRLDDAIILNTLKSCLSKDELFGIKNLASYINLAASAYWLRLEYEPYTPCAKQLACPVLGAMAQFQAIRFLALLIPLIVSP